MIDFPIDELLDEHASLEWLERHLHPDRLQCPRCGSVERHVARQMGVLCAYRCKACDRYHSILTGTVFEKTRQPPSKLVLILRGIAKGESTARLAHKPGSGKSSDRKLETALSSGASAEQFGLPNADQVVLKMGAVQIDY